MRFSTVADLMSESVLTVAPDTDLATVYDLMEDEGIRHLPVVVGEELIGIVSQRDLLRGALGGLDELPLDRKRVYLAQRTVESIMTPDPETADADEPLSVCAERLLENHFDCMPVVEGARLVGIITATDFVRAFAEGG